MEIESHWKDKPGVILWVRISRPTGNVYPPALLWHCGHSLSEQFCIVTTTNHLAKVIFWGGRNVDDKRCLTTCRIYPLSSPRLRSAVRRFSFGPCLMDASCLPATQMKDRPRDTETRPSNTSIYGDLQIGRGSVRMGLVKTNEAGLDHDECWIIADIPPRMIPHHFGYLIGIYLRDLPSMSAAIVALQCPCPVSTVEVAGVDVSIARVSTPDCYCW